MSQGGAINNCAGTAGGNQVNEGSFVSVGCCQWDAGQLHSKATSRLVSAWLLPSSSAPSPSPPPSQLLAFPWTLRCFSTSQRSPLSAWIFLITLVSPDHCFLPGRPYPDQPGNLCHEVEFHPFLLALGSLPSAQGLTGRGVQ